MQVDVLLHILPIVPAVVSDLVFILGFIISGYFDLVNTFLLIIRIKNNRRDLSDLCDIPAKSKIPAVVLTGAWVHVVVILLV